MRVVLPIIGALIGWNLGSPATHAFDLAIGAAVGFAIADLGILRARLDELGAQVARLTRCRAVDAGRRLFFAVASGERDTTLNRAAGSTATRTEADLSQIPATAQIAAAAVGSRRVLGGAGPLDGIRCLSFVTPIPIRLTRFRAPDDEQNPPDNRNEPEQLKPSTSVRIVKPPRSHRDAR
jgi:hypothetical protein